LISIVNPILALNTKDVGGRFDSNGRVWRVKCGRREGQGRIKLVEADGWNLSRTRGRHRQYHHPNKAGTVTIAGHPAADLDPKTKASILKQAGLK
jgi:predicted RNA binding protein YcfA (HicA-like mRNA interferase family)